MRNKQTADQNVWSVSHSSSEEGENHWLSQHRDLGVENAAHTRMTFDISDDLSIWYSEQV